MRHAIAIRPVRPNELTTLNRIARAAKAHWGYAEELLDAWQDDLTVDPGTLADRPVFVAEDAAGPAGFIQVATDTTPWEIWALWVSPDRMRRGIGRALVEQACRFARDAGIAELGIDADPNAEAFYRAMGARRVGSVPAPIAGEPDRARPQLVLPA
ncbi:MAG: GNAT family N-acetyltransferase [Rhodothermales bacterium]